MKRIYTCNQTVFSSGVLQGSVRIELETQAKKKKKQKQKKKQKPSCDPMKLVPCLP